MNRANLFTEGEGIMYKEHYIRYVQEIRLLWNIVKSHVFLECIIPE